AGATTDAGGAGGPIAAPPARRRKMALLAGAVALTLVASVVVFDSGGRLALPWPIGAASKGGTVAAAFPTVAVLPLVNLSGDPRRDYFSDGVTEDIISALGRFSGVRVMSRNAVQGFKGKSPSPQAIRDELGARYILQGSVREAGTTLRVAVELSDADHGTLLWSERYDGSDSEVFEIQDRIARKIVGNLQVQLTQLEQLRIFTKPTDSLEAYDLVLRARSLLDPPERSTNRQARDLLARAEALAPAYAEVFTALGEAEMDRVRYGWIEDTADGLKRAETFGKRALASLDQRAHSRAHALLVAVYTYQLRYDEALSEADRAIALNASDSTALFERGAALLSVGRFDEAIAAMEEGKRFEPHAVRINLPFAYYLSGRYREVIDEAGTMLVRAPSMVALHAIRGAAQAELGNANGARHEAEVVRRLSPYFQAENFANRFANPDHASRIHEGLRKAGL
ncbi:MAG: hypothetical protein ABIS68_00555, partial [Casimicrobiaceae bacterium]